jgi:hypothetical protein
MVNIFTSQKVRSRMESGQMGPYLSEIAAVLRNQGYARSTIRLRLRAADQFGAWLLIQRVSFNNISTSTVDRYLEGLDRQFSPSCLGGRLPQKALGVRELVEFLGLQGVLRRGEVHRVTDHRGSPPKTKSVKSVAALAGSVLSPPRAIPLSLLTPLLNCLSRNCFR